MNIYYYYSLSYLIQAIEEALSGALTAQDEESVLEELEQLEKEVHAYTAIIIIIILS